MNFRVTDAAWCKGLLTAALRGKDVVRPECGQLGAARVDGSGQRKQRGYQ